MYKRQALTGMVVPGYMVPDEMGDGLITVEEEASGVIILRCKDRRYQYSRYGLEEIS